MSVYSPFWLVNKTGLPLVFKQEGSTNDAPGQDEEHEVARMAAPLMFAFAPEGVAGLGGAGAGGAGGAGASGPISGNESSHVYSMMMRVGTGLHPEGKAQFCRRSVHITQSPKQAFLISTTFRTFIVLESSGPLSLEAKILQFWKQISIFYLAKVLKYLRSI